MQKIKQIAGNRRVMRLLTAGIVVLGLSAPALADHFDWSTVGAGGEPVAVTAEDAHVTCPEVPEGGDAEAAQAECDLAVTAVATELVESDHPENHGKYVSFVAHCLKGMKGKGQKMREIAQASDDSQMETAVRLCAEFRLEDASSEDEESASTEEVDSEDSDDDEDEAEEVSSEDEKPKKDKKNNKGGKGKGRR